MNLPRLITNLASCICFRGIRPACVGLLLAVASSQAANRTWDGGDPDLPGFWNAPTNWNGNTAIAAGDALFFPGTAAVKTMNNNLSISNFTKLTFNDDSYTLNGNSLRLTNGIIANYTPTGPTRINVGVMLGDDAAFEADDSSATLELNGPVNMLGFILTNQGVGNITWLAPFRSTVGGILRKRETGTVTVRSTNANFLGTVEISGGDFNVNGRMPAGAVEVNTGGTLGGTGLVHAVTVNSRGIIAPGGAARGVLTVTNGLTLQAGGVFEAEIFGSTAGTFDQLNVLGTVNIANATLNLTLNFIPVSPTAITIINNDGADAVLGTFSGLPQGAAFIVSDSIRATISYTGGTGNDVVITVSPLDTLTWTGSANGLWSVGANWVGGVAPQPGDSLVFPVVNVRKAATNDFPADTIFGLIRYETNYTLTGARATLRRGFHASFQSPAAGSLDLPLKLAATQTFTNQFQDLTYRGGIELGGFNLSFRNAGGAEPTISSEISGVGDVTHLGANRLSLNASNSFTGVLLVQTNRLDVGHPNAFGTAAGATVVREDAEVACLVAMSANSVVNEPVQLAGAWRVAATNLTWTGNFQFDHPGAIMEVAGTQVFTLLSSTLGTNGFLKIGSGTLRLATVQAAHGGTTRILGGTLQVDTALTNSILNVGNNGIVTGTGVVRQATFQAGSTFSPAGEGFGDGASSSATMIVTESLTFQSASVFRVNVNGPSANSYDQVDVVGTVSLGAGTATLDVALGYAPVLGQSFAILDNDGADPVSGSFAGWSEGGTNVVNGHALRITYTGGTGNDIVLTKVPGTRTWTGLGANNLWTTPENWTGNFPPETLDRLVFPPTALQRTNVNNYVPGTSFGSLDVRGSYQLDGAAIGLQSGVFAVCEAQRWSMNVPVTLLGSQTFSLSNNFNFAMVWESPIQLGAHTLTLEALGPNPMLVRGAISGAGQIRKTGPDIIALNSDNTYTGLTRVEEGALELRNRFSLGSTNPGTVVSSVAVLTMNTSELAEPVTLEGRLHFLEDAFASVPLTVSGNATIRAIMDRDVTFFQPISGDATLTFRSLSAFGDGPTFHLAAANPVSGVVQALGVNLDVDGSIPNAPLVLAADIANQVVSTLTGTGLVRALSVGADCILSPAGLSAGDGTGSTLVVTQSLVMHANSIYRVNLNGPIVQVYDQVDVLGTVNLGAGVANLDVQFGFTPLEGQTFIILDNDGADAITGTFAGKPQGAIFTAGGQRLQISYTGGTGNDIALTVLGPEELTWTGTVNGNWGTSGNWSPARAPQGGDRLIFPGGTLRRLTTNNLFFTSVNQLHSLRFTGGGASNNNFEVFGDLLFVSNGIVVSNTASATFHIFLAAASAQTFLVNGTLTFRDILNGGQITVLGSGNFRSEKELQGNYRGEGGTWTLGGICPGNYLLSNVVLNYSGQQQVTIRHTSLTNGVFRLNGTNATTDHLLLVNSLLDVASDTTLEPVVLLRTRVLEFLGTSRLFFRHEPARRPVIQVANDVFLNNATLVLSNITAAFSQPITVINNRGGERVTGTFAGLPEGAEIFSANGIRLLVSYEGGDGNDVTLTPVAPITGVTRIWDGGGVSGRWSEAANWSNNIPPSSGDSLVFPNAPKPVNTNDVPQNFVNQLRFVGTTPVARELRLTNTFGMLQLLGGIDFRETGTLRIPVTNTGFLSFMGLVSAQASQSFFVTNGGTVTLDVLTGLPGAVITKTGGGTLELGYAGGTFSGSGGMTLRQQAGLMRVGQTTEPIEQTGGTLEVLELAQDVTLSGGNFQTAPVRTNDGVELTSLAVVGTTPVVIRPGGEGAVGLLTVTNGVTLQTNATLRLDIADAFGAFGLTFATNDLIDLDDTGDFRPNNARLELNFLPSFNPSPTNRLLLTLVQNARTNLGGFAGLPQLGLLTNEFGVFRIYYRDFTLPPPLNIFSSSTNHDSVILERTIARPILLPVINGPGAFKTVTGLGTLGALYVIEGSDDLENWTALSGETANALTGVFTFIDATGLPFRFYRARLP